MQVERHLEGAAGRASGIGDSSHARPIGEGDKPGKGNGELPLKWMRLRARTSQRSPSSGGNPAQL